MAVQQQGWTGYCEGAKTGYSHLAPKFATKTRQINQPLGMEKAKAIAFELGITKDTQLTKKEYKDSSGQKEHAETIQTKPSFTTVFRI